MSLEIETASLEAMVTKKFSGVGPLDQHVYRYCPPVIGKLYPLSFSDKITKESTFVILEKSGTKQPSWLISG